jgi:hypothetical protein
MSSGSQARTLRREAASLFASRSREADDSVLVKTERACDVSRVVATRVCARRVRVFVNKREGSEFTIDTNLYVGSF